METKSSKTYSQNKTILTILFVEKLMKTLTSLSRRIVGLGTLISKLVSSRSLKLSSQRFLPDIFSTVLYERILHKSEIALQLISFKVKLTRMGLEVCY